MPLPLQRRVAASRDLEGLESMRCGGRHLAAEDLMMIDNYAIRLLLAAESLAYLIVAWGWWRVWRQTTAERVSLAALLTAACVPLRLFRIALALILSTP